METSIYLFERTSDVDTKGMFILRHRTLVTLTFTAVELEGMAGINGQNVLEELVLTELDPATNDGRTLRVELVPSYGLGATFECKGATVSEVHPYQPAA